MHSALHDQKFYQSLTLPTHKQHFDIFKTLSDALDVDKAGFFLLSVTCQDACKNIKDFTIEELLAIAKEIEEYQVFLAFADFDLKVT